MKLLDDSLHSFAYQSQEHGAVPVNIQKLQTAINHKLTKEEFRLWTKHTYKHQQYHNSRFSQFLKQCKKNSEVQFTSRRVVLFIIVLLWVLVLWSALIYKTASEQSLDVFEYFTNLSFLFQAVYYTIYLCVYLENPYERCLEKLVVLAFFFVLFSQILLVFTLVLGVLGTAPQLLTNEMECGGGEYDDGIVLLVERLFHVFPAIISVFVLWGIWDDIGECAILVFGYIKRSKKKTETIQTTFGSQLYSSEMSESCYHTWHHHVFVDTYVIWFYLFAEYVLACLPFILYMLIIDLEEQYEVPGYFSTWVPILCVLGLNLVFVGLPVLFLGFKTLQQKYVVKNAFEKICEYEETISQQQNGLFQSFDRDGNKKIYLKFIPGIELVPL